MIKYIIALLVVVAALAGLLLYIGDDVSLSISSSAQTGFLAFSPVELSWQIAIILGAILLFMVIGVWSLLGWLWRLPGRVKSGVGLRRRNQALEAMEDALVAGAEGDMNKSRKKAQRARALIGSEDLGRMVSAQAAEASGDLEEAQSQYKAMLGSEKTRATGQRGLAQNMLEAGNLSAAIEQSQAAYSENKHARWAFQTLFKAQAADFQWTAALETLTLGESRKHISKEQARRRRVVLQTAEANRLYGAGEITQSLDLASQAAQSVPEFSPAAALAAKLYVNSGSSKKAANLIEKSWSHAPHPALALAFLDIQENESAKTRAKRIASLVKHKPNHRESILLLAEEALRKSDGVAALALLTPYLQDNPSARLCVLAAQTETILNNPADSALWMQRAAMAPREADWSDLDPSGQSFDYSDQDWLRLIFSFGENGELIHPRAERQAPVKLPSIVTPSDKVGKDTKQKKTDGSDEKNETTNDAPMKDLAESNLTQDDVIEKDNLADRLDSLLDKPST
ncbi:MAG: heme biosynthesis HemY N-terminal domain-containing protein [Litorimonas sp.]